MEAPILQAAILGTPLAFAWRSWQRDCHTLRLTRRVLAVTGLGLGSAAVIGHILLVTHIRRIGGIEADWSLLDWSRLVAVLAALAIPLSLSGKGRSRWLGAFSSTALVALQVIAFSTL